VQLRCGLPPLSPDDGSLKLLGALHVPLVALCLDYTLDGVNLAYLVQCCVAANGVVDSF
jgi:hypothetical protein